MRVITNGMAPHRSRAHRTQINGEIDETVVADFQALWRRSGRRRWEVLQDVVALGIAEYQRREELMSPRTLDLLTSTQR